MTKSDDRPYRLVLHTVSQIGGNLPPMEYQKVLSEFLWQVEPNQFSRIPELAATPTPDAKPPLTIGIWDIDASLAYLYPLVEQLNVRREQLVFFEVVASVPLGKEANPARIEELLRNRNYQVTDKDRKDFRQNIVAGDVFPRAGHLRLRFSLDHLIGIVRSRLFDDFDGDNPDWNLFATARDKEALVSVDEVADYANQAARSFEAATGYLILSILYNVIYGEELYHEETRGCLFDFNEDRNTLVVGLKSFSLCKPCWAKISERGLVEPLEAILTNLRDFSPPG